MVYLNSENQRAFFYIRQRKSVEVLYEERYRL